MPLSRTLGFNWGRRHAVPPNLNAAVFAQFEVRRGDGGGVDEIIGFGGRGIRRVFLAIEGFWRFGFARHAQIN